MFSLLIAAVIFFVLFKITTDLTTEKVYSDSYQIRLEKMVVSELQTFIREESISTEDGDALYHWLQEQKGFYIVVYSSGKLWMDSYYGMQYSAEGESGTAVLDQRGKG